jgi:acyl-coenzyme A thioesterase PaaI-like protein
MPLDALLAHALTVTLHGHLGFCVADAGAAAALNQRLPPSNAANR